MAQGGTKKIFEYKEDINGKVPVIFTWSFDYNYVACGGDKQLVYILDKRGKRLKDIAIPVSGKLLQLEWDKDSEVLCIVVDGHNFVHLWQVFASNQLTQLALDNPKAKVCWARWSRSHGILAVASDKGGILFYTKKQSKTLPTMGKHSKKIISGDWNNEGFLITSGEDKMLTVSNFNSETVYESIPVKAEAKNIQWSRSKTDNRDIQQRTVTAVIQQKAIIMFELGKNHKLPDELVFENKYGKIVDYQIFGDGYIVVGFTEGYVAHISTHRKEIKDEVQSEKLFNTIDSICTNDTLYKLAVAGEGKIKMVNLSTWQEIKNEQIDLPNNVGRVTKLSWSNNGQTLIVATEKGILLGFLTSVPTLTAISGSLIAIQQSFTEMAIFESSKQQLINVTNIILENEPNSIALSQQYLAASLNNVVSYYKWLDLASNKVTKGGQLCLQKDYMGFVTQVFVNDYYAAVLSDGRCTLHKVENQDKQESKFEKVFPQSDQDRPNQSIGLTRHFLVLLDVQSKIKIYNIQDQAFIIEYKNEYSLTKIFPNISGTRSICTNSKGHGFLFEASTESITRIVKFSEQTERVIWDQRDPNLFILQENQKLTSYLVNKNNLFNEIVCPIPELLSLEDMQQQSVQPATTEIDKGLKVLSLSNGFVKCYTPQGTLLNQSLSSHSFLNSYKGAEDNQEGHFRYFLQNVALCKFANAFKAAVNLKNTKLYDTFGRRCLENLEFDVAQRAFQKANNISMVMMIQSFKHETEKNLLFAQVAMILGHHDLAQDLFLKSSYQLGALELRCDIQDYANALTLAKQIAKDQEPFICKRLGIQIETQGNNPEALKMYERAQLQDHEHDLKTVQSHNAQCIAGIARCSIKMGDILRGQELARKIKDNQIIQEIALVCENMKQYIEAAELYEQAGVLEKAASLYISQKMFKQAAPLMNKIRSPKLLTLYAKAKESEGQFQEAESAYEKAEEWESVVRLNLNQLDNIEKAKFVLRNKCQTTGIALMVAQYCERRGSKGEAIEFLIMAGKKEEAFALAQNYNEMDAYSDHMKAFSLEERLRVAQYYEGKNILEKAAFHYEKAQDPLKALRLYQLSGEESIPDMIELVQRNKQDNLIQNLLDYLTGETDDNPKEPQFAYKLYKAIGNLPAASRIAITIAQQEQEQGKYKDAHQILFDACDDMRSSNNQIPFELHTKLLTLHSYVIVRRVIKMEEHEDAARLLDRVSKSISQFPQHGANILTTAVIEATRANFKQMAFQWAALLMKPEYRPVISEKYKKQIENIARKPVKEEIPETKTPCPFCNEYVPEFSMDCPKCSNNIPFCIASGKHIVADQCCLCPECKFPANIQYLKKLLELEQTCPLCNKDIRSSDLREITREEVQKLKRKNINEEKQQQQQ